MAGKNMFDEIFLVVTKQHPGKGEDTPGKIHRSEMEGWKKNFLVNWVIFKFHVFSEPYEVSGALLPKYDLLDSLWDGGCFVPTFFRPRKSVPHGSNESKFVNPCTTGF